MDNIFLYEYILIFILLLPCLCLIILCIFGGNNNFRNKERLIKEICSSFENLRRISPGQYKGDVTLFCESFVIPKCASKSTFITVDDSFRGIYKHLFYEIVEIKAGHIPKFQGVIIRIEMNKKFMGHTVVLPKKILHTPPSFWRLKRTILEDVKFENQFDVFCNNEVEARYLITTAFMERFLNLKTAFSSSQASCAFYKGNLFIALQTKQDLFSIPATNQNIDYSAQYKIIYNEITSIIKLIDYFKINEKTGL